MQASVLVGQVISAIAARLHAGAPPVSPVWDAGDTDGWMVTLASLLVVFAVGGVASRLAGRLLRRPVPELTMLLNQSAAFYSRWAGARRTPPRELRAEATRCRRIIEILESRAAAEGATPPAVQGSIDGLRAWIALLDKQIQGRSDAHEVVYA